MRVLFVAAVLAGLAGCGGPKDVTAGGKPIEYWFEALSSPDARLRREAVTKLGHVGPENTAVLPALVAALRDADAEVRRASVLALSTCGEAGREAIPALVEVRRSDPSARVRDHAARALAALERKE